MITLAGATHLSFTFPAQLNTAVAYYRDIPRTLALLPHISLVRQLGVQQYRLMYSTIELRVYQVKMICDIQVLFDEANGLLRIEPLEEHPPVKSAVTPYSLTAQGYYHSESIFCASSAAATQIDYRLQLDARLPIPFASRLMPTTVLNGIARNITNWRIHEIAQGFIERSLEDFQSQSGQVV